MLSHSLLLLLAATLLFTAIGVNATVCPTCAPKSAVVIGAGPAGMAAALALKLHGVPSVTVIEKRGPTPKRVNMLTFRSAVLSRCAHDFSPI